jgi:hypothetical protein
VHDGMLAAHPVTLSHTMLTDAPYQLLLHAHTDVHASFTREPASHTHAPEPLTGNTLLHAWQLMSGKDHTLVVLLLLHVRTVGAP